MSAQRQDGRACVARTPPSAKLVFTVLCHEGALTLSELLAETRLHRSTVADAVAALRDCGVVDERVSPLDARQKVYEPHPDCC